MKYFHLNFDDAGQAMRAVWQQQDEADVPHTSFHMSAEGMDTSVWTEDADGEVLFRQKLDTFHLFYEEGDEQQVKTFLDRYGF